MGFHMEKLNFGFIPEIAGFFMLVNLRVVLNGFYKSKGVAFGLLRDLLEF